ncbi:MAG TPA: hypothetical protein VNT26_11115, partial [Candidatus Sulfotelmatobacter sp.]|nr:hypothetical protein [Candidatus Sulfotelmatobacter sp.]
KWARSDSELVDESWQGHYEQAKAELNAQIKDRLGEQRFAAYQRGADEDFHRLTSTVSRYNLPRQSAEQVYELKRTLESLNNQVRTNASLTPEQKETALKAMRAETEKEVKGLLGETAYQYYLWKGHASWLVK